METCDLCGGPLALLGQLGNLLHTRCVNCGAQFSQEAEPDPDLVACPGCEIEFRRVDYNQTCCPACEYEGPNPNATRQFCDDFQEG